MEDIPLSRRSYDLRFRRKVLDALLANSQHEISRRFRVPRRTLRNWLANEPEIRAFSGSSRRKSMKSGGGEGILFAAHLLSFMKDARRDERVRALYDISLLVNMLFCALNLRFVRFIGVMH